MDAKKFGAFVADMRREKKLTQKELAEKLNVTDKAVSKWERGLGFPDISTIEPLANALDVSVLELMQSERVLDANIQADSADTAILDTFELAKRQKGVPGKIVAMMVAAFLLGASSVLLLPYAEEASRQYIVMTMYVLRFAIFPAFTVSISLLLMSVVKMLMKAPLVCSKSMSRVFLIGALFLLALYISAVLPMAPGISVLFPVELSIFLLSARYAFSVVIGILLGLIM